MCAFAAAPPAENRPRVVDTPGRAAFRPGCSRDRVHGTDADETIYCTQYINSVPYTITQAGHYCLIRNVTSGMASGTAIRIAADNVWLDLNNFALDASAAGSSTAAWGISAEGNQPPTSEVVLRDNIVVGAPAAYAGACTAIGATNYP